MVRHPLPAEGRRLLLALTPVLLVLEVPGAVELWRRPFLGFQHNNLRVESVEAGSAAAAAGVAPGDLLLRVAGRLVANDAQVRAALYGVRAGDHLVIELDRGQGPQTLQLALQRPPLRRRWQDFLQSVTGLCFLFLGFVTFLHRDDAMGRHFYLSCVIFAVQLLDQPTFPWPGVMLAVATLRDVLTLFLPAEFLRFCLIFPEGIDEAAAQRRRDRWLLVPPLLLSPLHVWANLTVVDPAHSPLVAGVGVATALLFAVYMVAALWVFGRKARRRDRWVLWSKLRLASLGLSAGLLPIAITAVARQLWPAMPLPLERASVLMLPLVPASFSVALLRTRAIDLGDLLRQGLIALALTLLLVPPAAGFLLLVGPLLGGAGRGMGYVLTVVTVFALSVSAVPVRRRVVALVDRLLYPEQRKQRTQAARLATALNRTRDPQALAQLLCSELLSLFHGTSAALYAVEGDQVVLLNAAGTVPRGSLPERLPASASLPARVLSQDEMVLVEPMLTGPRPIVLDEASRRLLATDCSLLCPLASSEKPLALLTMGPPRAGGMFGAFALHEIEMIAGHASAALENAILHREDLARARLAVEMSLAREIQAHLMPAEDLRAGPFVITGQMASSSQVGGDVFDYFALGDGRVMLAVADASGKGVPASLLMSSLRAALREALQPGVDLVQATARLNRHVHGMTSDRHFIALFLAALEPATGVLHYVVAGLDPPLWARTSPERVERLTRGGPVLGIDTSVGFREGTIRLTAGDVVLAYTDGITDQENATGEAFGPERLCDTLLLLRDRPAAEIRHGVFAAVTSFGNGDATDDKTLLVLKFQPEERAGTEAAAPAVGT